MVPGHVTQVACCDAAIRTQHHLSQPLPEKIYHNSLHGNGWAGNEASNDLVVGAKCDGDKLSKHRTIGVKSDPRGAIQPLEQGFKHFAGSPPTGAPSLMQQLSGFMRAFEQVVALFSSRPLRPWRHRLATHLPEFEPLQSPPSMGATVQSDCRMIRKVPWVYQDVEDVSAQMEPGHEQHKKEVNEQH